MQQLTLFNDESTELTSDDYYTPKWIFDALNITFDLDPASPVGGPSNTPCRQYFTKQDNGLVQDWHGSVFLNPPFSKTTPWVTKWLTHANGVILVPMSKSKWFNDLWNSNATIIALPSNLKFDDPTGGNGSIFIACLLAALGTSNIKALNNLGKTR